jgi:thioredoxin 1
MTALGYQEDQPTRDSIDALTGEVVLEFGANWCGICRAAKPAIENALADRQHLNHIKVADGKGRRLGRSFRVKLWPTLVLMRDGEEVGRVVRPRNRSEIDDALIEAGFGTR